MCEKLFCDLGYDMEDAMILNKSAVERGLAHGTVIKSESIDLRDDRGKDQKFAPEASKPGQHMEKQISALGQKFPQNIATNQSNMSVTSRHVRSQVYLLVPDSLLDSILTDLDKDVSIRIPNQKHEVASELI